ncbi:TIMELESS-interacting protein-like [Stegodyphus dumicola]|uniref:TIMELESS-interacting protein-like n=1 Tax=Stegodyphus dumicola TaxID=202533 RepID=UPI0015ACEA90|nr:TIMELESS-interacting protein-like [Stegodyphus dumicola]
MDGDVDGLDELFEENENANEEQNAENKDRNEPQVVPAPKRIVKHPRLKFNAERLCGERGIPVVVKHFKDVKFKGPGHEEEDLDKLLAKLEHWAHRLFPSMKLEDCLHQIEKLGKKRPVQTCLRKIRLDMPVLKSDFVQSDEEKDETQRMSDPEIQPQDAFDSLLEDRQVMQDEIPVSTPMYNAPKGHILGTSSGSSLTEEQKKRMEYNKMLAAERRRARLAAANAVFQNDALISSPVQVRELSHEDKNPQPEFDKLLSSDTRMEADNQIEHQVVINEVSDIDRDCDDLITSNCGENSYKLRKDIDMNSEKLGLDSLLDLVDEDETKKLTEGPLGSSVTLTCDVNAGPSQCSSMSDKLFTANKKRSLHGTLIESTFNVNQNDDSKITPTQMFSQNGGNEFSSSQILIDKVNTVSENYDKPLDTDNMVLNHNVNDAWNMRVF